MANKRHIAHEIKNQLSICDLYTEIIQRYCSKNGISDDAILKSVDCIKRALKLAGNSLLELKTDDIQELKEYSLCSILKEAKELASVYTLQKNIIFSLDIDSDENIIIDKNRFLGVIINLVKNACEAFEEETENNYINIRTEEEGSIIKIIVSNNAKPIENIDIFEEGFTTKETGNGLGLYISRKYIEEMGGALKLLKSDNTSTEFCIMLKHSL